ncbi:CAMK family protein kinase [Naegleria gruberi]|uniref:CAMK family protein kinase n=1 Tax=Naegleria gruberi TaxID=5762 RepID=D2VU97_NAEGR|nr:CAMK family protein kinase [Naegleria gruberi]EFC39589.1 CAMK family protein kinase [Naegleria gruberi]|eukprot:XP_002672333.1 CAMK family protein kinase [Naegleria gruberi strain NEG-M]
MLNSFHKREREYSDEEDTTVEGNKDDQADEPTSGPTHFFMPETYEQAIPKKKKLMDYVNIDIENKVQLPEAESRNAIEHYLTTNVGASYCKKIGEGGGGDVYLVKKGNTMKAVKHIRSFSNEYSRFDEVFQIAKLKHDHIIEIDDYYLINNEFCFEMDYYEKGSLETYKNKLTVGQLFQIACQISSAIKYISEQELCHRDVKIANILVKEITDSNIYVVLTDFGVSFKKNSYKPYQFKTGTEQYYDPEIEKYFNTEKRGLLEFPFKTETDLYALGVTLERLSNKTTINSTPLLKEIITSLTNSTLPTRMKMMNVLADISLATTIAFKDPKNRTQWDKYLHACVMNPNCFIFCPYNKNKRFIYKVLDINHHIFEMVPDDLLDENIVIKSIRDVRSVLIFQNRNKACIDKFKSLISHLIDVHVLRNVQYNTGERIQTEMEKLSESQLEILVYYNSRFFKYFPIKYTLNRNIVFSFIKKVEECFQHCSYRDDEEIIQYVLEKNPKFITFISFELRFKYEQQYAKEILEVDPSFYSSLSEISLKDRLFAKLAMKGCKSQRDFDSNFDCLPEDLKTQDFFIEIITENSKTFHNLKNHLDHDSLVQGFSHLIHAIEVKEQGNELMQKCSDDIELVNQIIEISPDLYENLSCNNLKNNEIIIETYLNHTYYPRLSKDLKLDDEFQAKHLKKLIDSGYITKPNRELVRSGIFKSKDIGLLLYLESKDLDDKEFMLPILEKFPRAYLSCRSLLIDKEIIKMVIRKNDEIYEDLDTTFQKDEEILSVLNEPKSSIDSIMAEVNDNTSEK